MGNPRPRIQSREFDDPLSLSCRRNTRNDVNGRPAHPQHGPTVIRLSEFGDRVSRVVESQIDSFDSATERNDVRHNGSDRMANRWISQEMPRECRDAS